MLLKSGAFNIHLIRKRLLEANKSCFMEQRYLSFAIIKWFANSTKQYCEFSSGEVFLGSNSSEIINYLCLPLN